MKKFHVVKDEFRKHTGEVELPKRSTKDSAGYDIKILEDITIPPMTIKINYTAFDDTNVTMGTLKRVFEESVVVPHQELTWTDIAIELESDEFLSIHPRSGLGTKLGVTLANTTGIIDSDYINNNATGGNIGICLKNFSDKEIVLKKGERIAQGIISKYLITDDDNAQGERTGGFGSSGK